MLAGEGGRKLEPARIAAAAEASLKRLGTDYIDLYYAHQDDEGTPLEESLRAFDSLVRAGKVRAIGASNYSAGRLREALSISKAAGIARYEVLQPEYHLMDREPVRRAAASRSASTRGSACSPISRSPTASSPASTGPRPISAKARAAAHRPVSE